MKEKIINEGKSPSKIGKQINDVLGDLWTEELKKLRKMSEKRKKEFLRLYKKSTRKDFPYPI